MSAAALAPDPALPQRDLLLDPRRVAIRLEPALTDTERVRISVCEVVRVKYRVGESLRVRYRIETADGEWALALRAFPTGASEHAFQRAGASTRRTGGLRPLAHLRELESVVWVFPNDRKLDLDVVRTDSPALAALLGRPPSRCRLVAYAPEKAATVRCEDAAARALGYVKVYGAGEHERPLHAHQSLHEALAPDHPHLQLPRVLGSSSSAIAVEPFAGASLGGLWGRRRDVAYERLGAAAATLHELPPPIDVPFERLELHRLHRAAEVIARARPDVGMQARRLLDRLGHTHEPSAEAQVCLHGDLHPKNALLSGDRVALIDLDQVSAGPAAAELGGLLAGLRYERVTQMIDTAVERRLRQRMLTGYASVRPLPPAPEIQWHTAAALLGERALRAVNRVRPLGLRHLPAMLTDAEELLR